MKKKIIILLMVIMTMVFVTACNKNEVKQSSLNKIDVTDFIEIKTEGGDGNASIKSVNVSAEDVTNSYIKNEGLDFTFQEIMNGDLNKENSAKAQEFLNIYSFVNAIKFEANSATEGLKNGDTVKYQMMVDEKVSKETGCELAIDKVVCKIVGLTGIDVSEDNTDTNEHTDSSNSSDEQTEKKDVEIMKFITVKTTGSRTDIKVEVNTDNIPKEYDDLYEVKVEPQVTEGHTIKNGDKVIVKVINKAKPDSKITIKDEEREFTVKLEDTGAYPTTLTQAQSNRIIEMGLNKAKEELEGNTDKFFLESDQKVERSSIETVPVKSYFAFNKEDPSKNYFITLFKTDKQGVAKEHIQNNEVAGEFEEGDLMFVTQYSYAVWEGISLNGEDTIDEANMHMTLHKAAPTTNTEEAQQSAALSTINDGFELIEITQ